MLLRRDFTAVPVVANNADVLVDKSKDKIKGTNNVPKVVGDENHIGCVNMIGGSSECGDRGIVKLEPLPGRNQTGSSLFAGKKVLVVDDAVAIVKLMSHTLTNKAEAIVTQAKDGQQAVEECEKQHFDLILTDIQMPQMDGFGEARCIRAMEKERGLPRKFIVGISANTQARIPFLFDTVSVIIK